MRYQELDQNLKEELKKLLANGDKIAAVALVQNRLKIGLKNSKDLVDGLENTIRTNALQKSPNFNL